MRRFTWFPASYVIVGDVFGKCGSKPYCLQMAAKTEDPVEMDLSPPVYEGGQETSYIFVRGLGAGAFAEANLYRKIEVSVIFYELLSHQMGHVAKTAWVTEEAYFTSLQ